MHFILIEKEIDHQVFDLELFKRHKIFLPESLNSAVDKRKGEFLFGRLCASEALQKLGIHTQQISIGPDRGPVWPEGIIGSITHTQGYVAAAVGFKKELRAIGIDAEGFISPVKDGMKRMILVKGELENLQLKSNLSVELLFTLVFSAKESLYKALRPIVGKFFGFQYAKVQEVKEGFFRIELIKSLPPWESGSSFEGVYRFHESRVFCQLVLQKPELSEKI